MVGIGDGFAARPTIAALRRKSDFDFATPWPELYADMHIRCVRPDSQNIRCAKRNVEETRLYKTASNGYDKTIQLSYALHPGCKDIPTQIAESAGVLGEVEWSDFFINLEWNAIEEMGPRTRFDRLGVFRATTVRTEYRNRARNCNMDSIYAAIDEIGGDWLHLNGVGRDVEVFDNAPIDMKLGESSLNSVSAIHSELSFPSMLDLVSRARCVVTPISWLAWAALAYQVPHLIIWGGYAGPETILGPLGRGANITLPDPGCKCFRPDHDCAKSIPVERVREAARCLK